MQLSSDLYCENGRDYVQCEIHRSRDGKKSDIINPLP